MALLKKANDNVLFLASTDNFLTTKEFEQKYKVPRSTQCRHRRDGDGPPFVMFNHKVLYPESGVLSWLTERLQFSSAEDSSPARADRYKHLPQARTKALEKRALKFESNESSSVYASS